MGGGARRGPPRYLVLLGALVVVVALRGAWLFASVRQGVPTAAAAGVRVSPSRDVAASAGVASAPPGPRDPPGPRAPAPRVVEAASAVRQGQMEVGGAGGGSGGAPPLKLTGDQRRKGCVATVYSCFSFGILKYWATILFPEARGIIEWGDKAPKPELEGEHGRSIMLASACSGSLQRWPSVNRSIVYIDGERGQMQMQPNMLPHTLYLGIGGALERKFTRGFKPGGRIPVPFVSVIAAETELYQLEKKWIDINDEGKVEMVGLGSREGVARVIAGGGAHEGSVSYVVSNCMEKQDFLIQNPVLTGRDRAYDLIVDLMHEHGCTRQQLVVPADAYKHDVQRLEAVAQRHARHKFALVFENAKMPFYVTEKILLAFQAGVVPIYYGATEVFQLFNREAFVYMDMEDPRPALEEIARAMEDEEVYKRYLRAPLLPQGSDSYYMSFSPSLGGGRLRDDIRTALGLDTVAECGGRDYRTVPGYQETRTTTTPRKPKWAVIEELQRNKAAAEGEGAGQVVPGRGGGRRGQGGGGRGPTDGPSAERLAAARKVAERLAAARG